MLKERREAYSQLSNLSDRCRRSQISTLLRSDYPPFLTQFEKKEIGDAFQQAIDVGLNIRTIFAALAGIPLSIPKGFKKGSDF